MTSVAVPPQCEPASILFVHDGENWIRGSERCMLDLVQYIDRCDFRPVVLCNAPAVAEAAAAAGASVHLMEGWNEAGEHLLPAVRRVRAVRAILDRYDVRLVHCNSALPIKSLLPAVRSRKIPLLAHLHIVHPLDTRLYLGLHQVALAVGVSNAAIAGLREDGMSESRLRVIYNAVDPERMRRGDARQLRADLGLSSEVVTLVALGSLIHRKAVDVLIHAMSILSRTHPEVHLLIVGDGEQRPALEQQVDNLSLSQRVHFLGEQSDVGAILRDASDIAVSAARQEAFPLNLLEAGYWGLPVVASDILPHRESIIPGETGLLVAPDSAEDFARGVHDLLATPDRGRSMGERGARRVHQGHLLVHYIAAFERTYRELIMRPKGDYGWIGASLWPAAYTRWVKNAISRRIGIGGTHS